MLQREDSNVDREALVETIVSSASRGADLIAQLLTFARGGEGQHVPLQVDQIIPEVAAILQRTLPGSIELVVEVEGDLSAILGDETEISQVIMNLAINARDAMLEGGTLRISAKPIELGTERSFSFVALPAGCYVAITVSDTGSGITTEVRERMFDPFFTTKPRGQGTGLGLSTSLGIVLSHRGAVDVQSKPGEGTAITAVFPLLDSDIDSLASESRSQP
mgnify:CR=1 FL=1